MAIIGLNDITGLGAFSETSAGEQKLFDHSTFDYLAPASEEVFKFGVYRGTNGGDGNGIEFGLYDLGTGPTTDGATLVATGTIASLTANAWNTVTITPVALTEGHYYAVAWRIVSATNITLYRASLTAGTSRHATLTGSSALGATWDEGTDLAQKYAVYAETQAASSTITDVDTDETIVPGQTGVVATGTNLSAGASARWVDTNGNALTMANYSAHATAPTFDVPSLATTLAAGVKFGSGTFEIWS